MDHCIYHTETQTQTYPALDQSITCEIAIIGGGLSGLHAAYQLRKYFTNICLFEADTIGYSNSGRNTGKITLQQGLVYDSLLKSIGIEETKAWIAAGKEAHEKLRTMIAKHHLSCDYETADSVIYATKEEDREAIEKEYQACRLLELDVDLHETLDFDSECRLALTLKDQAAYNPQKFCSQMARVLAEMNVCIYESTPIQAYEKQKDSVQLTSNEFTIKADYVVIATAYPCFDDGNLYMLRLSALRSYIVAGEVKAPFPPTTHYITETRPSKSLRYYQDHLMICGGDHRVGVEVPDPYLDLKELGWSMFHISSFPYAWSAQDYITVDHLPFCGPLSPYTKRMFVMTGYNQWGNLNAVICASLITALLKKQEHPLQSILNSKRLLSIFGPDFTQANLTMIGEMIRSKLQPKGALPTQPLEHQIVSIQNHTYGAYMDEKQQLFLVDILCPHAGCTLRFNAHEKTWDCPCHSSRFHYDGTLLSGPATKSLHRFNDGHNKIDPHLFD